MRFFWAAALGAAIATAQTGDTVSVLNNNIRAGSIQVQFDGTHGYLKSVLNLLHVPVESQMLVFSKTSSQAILIEPRNPRALYFNDSTVVGWVRGGVLEAMAQGPSGEIAFYTADQRAFVNRERIAKAGAPEALFERRDDCLHCHGNTGSHVPGAIVRSVFPSPDGVPLAQLPDRGTDHRTPFDHLWGGWYVTGSTGTAKHMGNSIVAEPRATYTNVKLEPLQERFNPAGYLSPYSDIAALMVFEHQMQMMNLLNAARVRDNSRELVNYLLFLEEPPLAAKVESTSGFAARFASEGVSDREGRSLRQLDLTTRLMRYPCSYMIYTAAFDGLPPAKKAAIYERMWRILSGEEGRMQLEDRRAIIEILRETKKDLPVYFQPLPATRG